MDLVPLEWTMLLHNSKTTSDNRGLMLIKVDSFSRFFVSEQKNKIMSD